MYNIGLFSNDFTIFRSQRCSWNWFVFRKTTFVESAFEDVNKFFCMLDDVVD